MTPSGVGTLYFCVIVGYGLVGFGLSYFVERWYNGHWLRTGHSPFSPERRARFRQQAPHFWWTGRAIQAGVILSAPVLVLTRIASVSTVFAVLLVGGVVGALLVRVAARLTLWADDDRSTYARHLRRAERWGLIRR